MSMGMIAARHARGIVSNAESVVALEVLAAAQALDLRDGPSAPPRVPPPRGPAIREVVPFLDDDRGLKADVDAAVELVGSRALVEAVESPFGPLD